MTINTVTYLAIFGIAFLILAGVLFGQPSKIKNISCTAQESLKGPTCEMIKTGGYCGEKELSESLKKQCQMMLECEKDLEEKRMISKCLEKCCEEKKGGQPQKKIWMELKDLFCFKPEKAKDMGMEEGLWKGYFDPITNNYFRDCSALKIKNGEEAVMDQNLSIKITNNYKKKKELTVAADVYNSRGQRVVCTYSEEHRSICKEASEGPQDSSPGYFEGLIKFKNCDDITLGPGKSVECESSPPNVFEDFPAGRYRIVIAVWQGEPGNSKKYNQIEEQVAIKGGNGIKAKFDVQEDEIHNFELVDKGSPERYHENCKVRVIEEDNLAGLTNDEKGFLYAKHGDVIPIDESFSVVSSGCKEKYCSGSGDESGDCCDVAKRKFSDVAVDNECDDSCEIAAKEGGEPLWKPKGELICNISEWSLCNDATYLDRVRTKNTEYICNEDKWVKCNDDSEGDGINSDEDIMYEYVCDGAEWAQCNNNNDGNTMKIGNNEYLCAPNDWQVCMEGAEGYKVDTDEDGVDDYICVEITEGEEYSWEEFPIE